MPSTTLDCCVLFRGSVSKAAVYPREIARLALARNTSAVVFAHNHPCGYAEPSNADRAITAESREALRLIDVRVLDHIVVGGAETVSFAESGLL